MSDAELLKFAIENGKLDIALVQERIEMQMKTELLGIHKYDIWQGRMGNGIYTISRMDVRYACQRTEFIFA